MSFHAFNNYGIILLVAVGCCSMWTRALSGRDQYMHSNIDGLRDLLSNSIRAGRASKVLS